MPVCFSLAIFRCRGGRIWTSSGFGLCKWAQGKVEGAEMGVIVTTEMEFKEEALCNVCWMNTWLNDKLKFHWKKRKKVCVLEEWNKCSPPVSEKLQNESDSRGLHAGGHPVSWVYLCAPGHQCLGESDCACLRGSLWASLLVRMSL